MAPFETPSALVSSLKERAEAVTVQADRLYVGTATGSLLIYALEDGNDGASARLLDTKKGVARRAIEQLGYVKDINSLIVLADSQVTLYPLPDFAPPTPLTKAKTVFSFAVHTFVEHEETDRPKSPYSDRSGRRMTVPTVITYLVVGCQRKVVVYSWKDGDAQDVKEASLPHSARTIAFVNNHVVSLSYDLTTHVLFSLDTLTVTELALPPVPSTSATGMGYLGKGLGGYMTLGLGSKGRPCAVNIQDSEVFLTKDNEGIFFGPDGKQARPERIEWPAPPSEISLVKPYIFSLLPAGTVPAPQTTDTAPSFIPSPVVQIHSSISLSHYQTLSFPFDAEPSAAHTLRLLTSSPGTKSPLYVISTPTDRTQAASEGSTIWRFTMKSWVAQLDELVEEQRYTEALALLDYTDPAVLPDKEQRTTLVKSLEAVARFQAGEHASALQTFMELNVNPAKVVALFPERVAGRLSRPRSEWINLFGGPAPKDVPDEPAPNAQDEKDEKDEASVEPTAAEELVKSMLPSTSGLMNRFKSPLDAIRPTTKDPDTASIASTARRVPPPADETSRLVESLLQYLPDRRAKLGSALETFNISAAQSHRHSTLAESSVEDLFALPNSPLRSLTPDQLVRCAQVVDTALFKAYLIVRPGLLGSFCRRDNWCEVSEMEGMLKERGKFAELIYLYNGKKMHSQALDLLEKLSENETDMEDKLRPSISYLQRLGPEHLDQIFKHSRWVLEQDADLGFEIFTSEEVALPKQHVASFLESMDPKLCARFLEFLISERAEVDADYHDRLAGLYLKMTVQAKKAGVEDERKAAYDKLLTFIDTTEHYRIDKIFGQLPSDDLYEAKAILLGRLGRHAAALELYAYRLHDYTTAEEYCKRVYVAGGETDGIYLTLLRIYLRPVVKTTEDLLPPALSLIARHGRRLDPEAALDLLPPLVRAQDVQVFLLSALRAPVFDTLTTRNVAKARTEQIARKLMYLESNRVKVTNTRICPQCHKRIGPSVIAVHSPAGEVTHYNCREPFAKKLKEMRRA